MDLQNPWTLKSRSVLYCQFCAMILHDCGTCSVSSEVLKFKNSGYKLFLRRQAMILLQNSLLSLLPTYKPTIYKDQPNQLCYLRVSLCWLHSYVSEFYFWLLPTLKLESNFFIKCLASIIKFFNNGAVPTPWFWSYFIILCITNTQILEKLVLIPRNILFPNNAML